MGRFLITCALGAVAAFGANDTEERAEELYHHTEYKASLRLLASEPRPTAAMLNLIGRNQFMLGEYKKATESFEKAIALDPGNSMYQLWLGRAWGRRAETGAFFVAPGNASRARQCFERAVALDPDNHEARNDLFDYYLNAPAFLGGGIDKAEAIARRAAGDQPAEAEFEFAQLAEHRKQFDSAEAHFRRAVEFAPREAGRVLDLARFLAKRGRLEESDARFREAERLAPNDPRIDFEQAKADIEHHRNLDRARQLLQHYLGAEITPDDPPKQAAEQLLRQVSGG